MITLVLILVGMATVGFWTYLLLQLLLERVIGKGEPAGNILFFKTTRQIGLFRAALYILFPAIGIYWGRISIVNQVILGVFGFVAAHFVGLWILKKLRERWIEKFEDQLEEASRLIANSLRAGLGFMQALEFVAREMPSPLRDKFQETITNIRLGLPIKDAMVELEKSVPESEELKNFTTAVVIQLQTGGSLADVMEQVAQTISTRRRLRRRIQALTAEGRLSAMVIVALPFFMAFMMNLMDKEYMRPMFEHWSGLLVWGLIIGMSGLAWWIISKIVNIEV